jgi:hypothetical protein
MPPSRKIVQEISAARSAMVREERMVIGGQPIPAHQLSDHELVQRIKSQTSDRSRGWGEFVKARSLSPAIDAKTFYDLFDSAYPDPHLSDTETVDFVPTHVSRDNPELMVMVTGHGGGVVRYALSYGGTGSDPESLFPERWRPI